MRQQSCLSKIRFALSFLFLALLIGACAKPQYLSPDVTPESASKAGDGCTARFKISNACVQVRWEKQPVETVRGSFVFTVTDAQSGLLVDLPGAPATSIRLSMPGMTHKNPEVLVQKLSVGTYKATNIFFLMSGLWYIHFMNGDDEAIYETVAE